MAGLFGSAPQTMAPIEIPRPEPAMTAEELAAQRATLRRRRTGRESLRIDPVTSTVGTQQGQTGLAIQRPQ